uniref:Uncharacterized protein n=1 Tax=Anopheles arabiensis TaxID=7173 RepID=A0A182I0G9_ANOAR
MFEANIHNNAKLAPVHKISYLKQSLKGEAASLVNSFPSTGASYTPAWNALIERYSNEYILKKRYINSLLQYPTLKSSSQKEIHALRVTFGLSPSSFLATRVLHQLAHDEGDNFPMAKEALLNHFYVDDYIGGANTEEEAAELYKQLVALLSKGGFSLQKWSTNSERLLESIPPKDRASKTEVNFISDDPVKTLGVVWLPASDHLYVQANTNEFVEPLTKRKVYSMIARLFDPIGLVAPIVSWAKIKMQKLWLASLNWDDTLPTELMNEWKEFHSNLPLLSELKIPRYVCLTEPTSIQLHCFADASEAAYGAVLYLRSEDANGQRKVEILAAKSRPAPLKRVSLARLELCAAVIAIRLWLHVSTALKLNNIESFMWSDSTVVLHWLKSPSHTWATYVANRVSLIQDTGKGCRWLHVKGKENPADLVSRGVLPMQLLTSTLWFHGPAWLRSSQEEWRGNNLLEVPSEEILERKKLTVATASLESVDWLKRFSCYWRVLKFTAYYLRWKTFKREKSPGEKTFLSANELKNAKEMILWKTEYLCELHNNNQRVPAPQRVAVGQMVILKEDNVTPCEWPLARIVEVHPGLDGVVRVVTLRTSQGLFKRPVSRICLLPFER